MRIWTTQDNVAYDYLCGNGTLQCDENLSEMLHEYGFREAYDWLAAEMTNRIGLPPQNVKYPIWGWYLIDGVNKKPDLRHYEFKNYSGENYIIEVEIPDTRVLLSDEEMWHIVLNDGYFCRFDNGSDIDVAYEWLASLPKDTQVFEKQKSWQNVFIKDCCPWRFVQATFWELKKEDIVSVRKFNGRIKLSQ